jgi:addiction module RelE/StbE family toxin
MKIKDVYYSSHFAKAFKRLPTEIRKQAIQKEVLFRENCFNDKLETHKLKGQMDGYWAFSINYSYRIIFEFMDNDSVGFIDVGTHSIYK